MPFDLFLKDTYTLLELSLGFQSCTQVDINFELEKLRTELRHVRGIYAIAQSEAIDASRKVSRIISTLPSFRNCLWSKLMFFLRG